MVEAVWLYPYVLHCVFTMSTRHKIQTRVQHREGKKGYNIVNDGLVYVQIFFLCPCLYFDRSINLTYHLFHFILHRHLDLSAKQTALQQVETIRCMFLHQLIIHNIYTSILNNQKRRRSVQYQLLLGLSLLSDLFGKY